jgi:hypothetical protein
MDNKRGTCKTTKTEINNLLGTLQIETENNTRSEWKFAFWKYLLKQTEQSQWYIWQSDCFYIKQREILELRTGTQRPVMSMERGQDLEIQNINNETCVKLMYSLMESTKLKMLKGISTAIATYVRRTESITANSYKLTLN